MARPGDRAPGGDGRPFRPPAAARRAPAQRRGGGCLHRFGLRAVPFPGRFPACAATRRQGGAGSRRGGRRAPPGAGPVQRPRTGGLAGGGGSPRSIPGLGAAGGGAQPAVLARRPRPAGRPARPPARAERRLRRAAPAGGRQRRCRPRRPHLPLGSRPPASGAGHRAAALRQLRAAGLAAPPVAGTRRGGLPRRDPGPAHRRLAERGRRAGAGLGGAPGGRRVRQHPGRARQPPRRARAGDLWPRPGDPARHLGWPESPDIGFRRLHAGLRPGRAPARRAICDHGGAGAGPGHAGRAVAAGQRRRKPAATRASSWPA